MFYFLIGFLILCVIIAIPELRTTALVLIGIAAIGLFLLFVIISNTSPPVRPLDPQQLAQQEAARIASAQAYEKSKTLITTDQLEVRNMWIEENGLPITVPKTYLEAGTKIVVKSNSENATLIEMSLEVKFFDCPMPTQIIIEKCDQIGSYRAQITGDVPPGQVRQMQSPFAGYAKVKDIPP